MATARDLLERVIAWPGPQDPGYVNVHWWSPNDKHPLPDDPRHKTWWGRPTRTLDDFIAQVNWALRQPYIRDIYFCTSVQRDMDKSKSGKPKPLRNRANAVNLKCFFLDVDYGKPDKDGKKVSYATLHEAVDNIAAFCLAKAIPSPSAYVSTGGGLHVYWILDQAVTPSEWQPYAEGLKSAALEHGLLCDAGVTIDCARILRVPDTVNWKTEPVRPCRVLGLKTADYRLADLKHLLDFAPVTATVSRVPMTWGDGTSMLDAKPGTLFAPLQESLTDGLEHETQLLDFVPIVTKCKFFGDALRTGGRDYANPLWNLSVLGATFVEKGHDLAHRLSDGHAGYSHESTEALWERKLREREDRNLGWPTCATIETNGCTACASCPLKGKIKSPLALGRKATPAAAAPPAATDTAAVTAAVNADYNLSQFPLPNGYVWINGIVHANTKVTDDTGAEVDAQVPLFTSRLTGAFCTREPDALNFTTTVDKGQYYRGAIKREELATPDSIKRALLREKVMFTSVGKKYLEDFFMSLMSDLERAARSQVNQPFGWHYVNGVIAGFVYGGKVFHDDGTVTDASYAMDMRGIYTPTGNIQPWYDACSMVTSQHAPSLECCLAVAFAAPLMVFPAEYSTLVWVWGVGGRGKSTALEIGMGVWGHPAKAKEQTASTLNSIMEKMGKTQNLPVYIDEISDEDSMRTVYKTFWQGTLGSTKGRLTSAITQRDKDSWHNQICTTSNHSIVDYIDKNHPTTDAAVRRVLELYVCPHEKDKWHVAAGAPGRIVYRDATAIKDLLAHNYGKMGLLYAEYLGKNHAGVKKIWKDIADDLDDELDRVSNNKDPSVERYWRAAMTTLLTGATLANRLGCDFHVQEMREYLIEQYLSNGVRLTEINVNLGAATNTEQQITSYLKYQRQNTIWTDKKAMHKLDKVKILRGLPLDREKGTEIQWCVEDRLLRVGEPAFKKWLGDVQKVATFPVIKSLKDHFGSTVAKETLGRNTKYAEGQENVINIPVPASSEWEQMMLQGEEPILKAVASA